LPFAIPAKQFFLLIMPALDAGISTVLKKMAVLIPGSGPGTAIMRFDGWD